MMKNIISALNMAMSMFTIIPIHKHIWEEKAGKYIMTLYPLVGLIVGGIWYGVFWLLSKLNCDTTIAAAILLSIPFLITGFIHLDGFMDVSDALLSRRPKEDKLRILKDSTVGAFSVISLALLLILQFAAIITFIDTDKNPIIFIIIPILSRSISAIAILVNEPIGESYYGKLFKEGTTKIHSTLVGGIYIIISLGTYFLGNTYLIMALFMLIAGYILVRNCKKELGGVNGDVAGYTLVLTELIGVLTVAVFA